MKIHVIYTYPEDQNEQICQDIVMEIEDEVITQEESATERKDDREHDSKSTRKRKLTDDGNNTTAKRKLDDNDNDNDELDLDALRKTLKEQTAEHDRILALGKGVDTILGEGEVKQTALSKDLQNALELYRNEDEDYDLYKDTVLYPWQEELMKHMTDKLFGLLEKTQMKGNHIFKNI